MPRGTSETTNRMPIRSWPTSASGWRPSTGAAERKRAAVAVVVLVVAGDLLLAGVLAGIGVVAVQRRRGAVAVAVGEDLVAGDAVLVDPVLRHVDGGGMDRRRAVVAIGRPPPAVAVGVALERGVRVDRLAARHAVDRVRDDRVGAAAARRAVGAAIAHLQAVRAGPAAQHVGASPALERRADRDRVVERERVASVGAAHDDRGDADLRAGPGGAAAAVDDVPGDVTEPPDWFTVTDSFPASPVNVITLPLDGTVPAAATPGAASTTASTSSASLSTASPSACPRGTCA